MELKGHAGSVTFDGANITVRKSMRGQVVIPLASLGTVMIVPAGIGMRGIKFTAIGSTAAQSVSLGGSHKDVARDPYALTFKKKLEPEFNALISQILAAKASAGV